MFKNIKIKLKKKFQAYKLSKTNDSANALTDSSSERNEELEKPKLKNLKRKILFRGLILLGTISFFVVGLFTHCMKDINIELSIYNNRSNSTI